jgi:outer membrane protein assembly factor BamB
MWWTAGPATFEGYPDVYTGNTSMSHYPGAVLVTDATLWVTVSNEDIVFQVDRDTMVATAVLDAPNRPNTLSSGDGDVFVACKHGATVYRLDADGTADDSTTIDEYVTNISVDDETIWVVQQQGAVARLDRSNLSLLDSYQTYSSSWSEVHTIGDMTGFQYAGRYLRP